MTTGGVYRVTVRGRFDGLDDRTRARLMAAVDEHDIFVSAYTTEGTFTYDRKLEFFNLRYEVRLSGEGANESAAGEAGLREAEAFLSTLGYGYKGLRAKVVDMATMWTPPSE